MFIYALKLDSVAQFITDLLVITLPFCQILLFVTSALFVAENLSQLCNENSYCSIQVQNLNVNLKYLVSFSHESKFFLH